MIVDVKATENGYSSFELDEVSACLWLDLKSRSEHIVEYLNSSKVGGFGIDFNKPFEQNTVDGTTYIEFIFVGELSSSDSKFIDDHNLGFNLDDEARFGYEIFDTSRLLNLTVVVENG